jgi:hypothetical protein
MMMMFVSLYFLFVFFTSKFHFDAQITRQIISNGLEPQATNKTPLLCFQRFAQLETKRKQYLSHTRQLT